MNRIERTKELVGILEREHTLSDDAFYELLDILEETGESGAAPTRHVGPR